MATTGDLSGEVKVETVRQKIKEALENNDLWMPFGMLSSKSGDWTGFLAPNVWKHRAVIEFLKEEAQKLFIAATQMMDALDEAEERLTR